MELAQASMMEHFEINGRHAWHYMIDSTIGEIHIVCHERPGERDILDDYTGRSNVKAEQEFRTIATKMLNGKA